MKKFLLTLAIIGVVSSPALYAAGAAKAHEKAASPKAESAKTSETAAPTNQTAAAEDENKDLTELCNTYAQEDGIGADKKATYVKDCLKSMTDLSESMQEPLPLVAGENNTPSAAPSSEQVNSDPEKLVKSEVVDTPDPNAEQLDAGKNH